MKFQTGTQNKCKTSLQVYGTFSCLWKVDPIIESIIQSGDFIAASMETCRKHGLSITPKSHNFEDYTIQYMQDLNDLGDKTEYFNELSHQYGVPHYK